MKQLSAERTPDDFFQRLDEIIIEVAGRFFSRGSTPEDLHYKTLKDKRMDILHRRRAHRAEMVDPNSDEQCQQLHQELHEMSKECKKARATIETHRKQRIMDELWDAWKARRFAECHRLLRRLAGSKYGNAKRNFATLQSAKPTAAAWIDAWSKPGAEGGMLATRVSWEAILAENKEQVQRQ